jgi:ATP-binding cassette, subfamily G (WHITE), member 2, PDR
MATNEQAKVPSTPTAPPQKLDEKDMTIVSTTAETTPEQSRTRATSLTEVHQDEISRDISATLADTVKADGDEGDDDEDSEMERRNSIVQALARQYTAQSHASVLGDPFTADENSHLNPNSPHFKASAWAKSVVNMVQDQGASFRTSGICYQNMNVYGFGEATDYQKTVSNIWLSATGLVRRAMGSGQRRIDILRSFDGVVRKGEMLVVLGPPGSGCSTLLKTIAGETSGLYIDDNAYFNYQGKSQLVRCLLNLGFFFFFFLSSLPAPILSLFSRVMTTLSIWFIGLLARGKN